MMLIKENSCITVAKIKATNALIDGSVQEILYSGKISQ
jgi:hypothetical protein